MPVGAGPPQAVRQPQGPDRVQRRRDGEPRGGAVGLRDRLRQRVQDGRLLPVGDVVDRVLPRPQLAGGDHGTFSGILCTGIIGGAVVPMLVGRLGNVFGLRAGMHLVFF